MSVLLNAKEVAERLRISKSTVYRLIRRKKLKILKTRSPLSLEEEEINAFIERHREQVEPEEQKTRNISAQSPKNSLN